MISYLGDFAEDTTVYIMFNTFSSDDPSASVTITNFINTDVHIHKDDGLTQRNNAAGITVSVDFDGITGSHMVKIDTSDNTVAGFWVVGHEYFVRIEGTTIDGATINSVIGQFSIENRFNEVDVVKWLGTAVATPTVAGVPEVDATHWLGTGVSVNVAGKPTVDVTNIGASSQSLIDLKDFVDSGYDPVTNKVQGVVLVDTTTTNTDMVGTDNAALAATALTDTTWTDAKAAFLDHSIATVDTNVDTLLTRITAARAGYLDNLSAGAVALASALATAQTDLDTITGTDGVTLATLQALYAPNKVIPDVAGTAAGLHSTTDGKIDTVDTNVDSILADTGTDGVLLAATATSAQLVDDVWDEILSGVTHNISGSAGRRVREIGAFAIHSGTAQAGTINSITLAATANGGDGVYNRNLIVITDNTGVGQTRTIVDYNDTTKVVVVDRDWRITPDNTTAYQIVPDNTPLTVDHGVAQGGTSTTITIRDYASSVDDVYLCNQIAIVAGTGRGQVRLVGAYDGTTKVVTICGANWVTTPDTTSIYVMMPYGTTCTNCIGTAALALINTECDTALADYDPPTRTEATADKDAIITEVNANETKIDALNDITVADIIAGVADGSYDLQEMMRIMFAALSGKSSGGGTTTLTFRDSGDAKNRITATVNSSGDRTAMTLDAT